MCAEAFGGVKEDVAVTVRTGQEKLSTFCRQPIAPTINSRFSHTVPEFISAFDPFYRIRVTIPYASLFRNFS